MHISIIHERSQPLSIKPPFMHSLTHRNSHLYTRSFILPFTLPFTPSTDHSCIGLHNTREHVKTQGHGSTPLPQSQCYPPTHTSGPPQSIRNIYTVMDSTPLVSLPCLCTGYPHTHSPPYNITQIENRTSISYHCKPISLMCPPPFFRRCAE